MFKKFLEVVSYLMATLIVIWICVSLVERLDVRFPPKTPSSVQEAGPSQ